jgi:RNA polymerase sigma factor (sigma-70 family)
MIDIGGVGDQKISYKCHKDVDFLPLSEYLLIAKKIVSKIGGSNKKYLQDDDVISYIANAIMMADWRWDNNYKSKEGRRKSQYAYRNQCGIWAIRTLLSKKMKTQTVYSLEESIDDSDSRTNLDFIVDKKNENPALLVENHEYNEKLKKDIKTLLSLNTLSDKQKKYIDLYYYQNKTLAEIGNMFGLTRESVRQNLVKAIKKLKEVMGNV